jgi:hypothetical protein
VGVVGECGRPSAALRSSEDSLVLVAFSYWLMVQPRGSPWAVQDS